MLPDLPPQRSTQLPLPLDLPLTLPQPPPLIEPRVWPQEVWGSVSGGVQTQIRLTWLRILREVIADAPQH